MKNYIVTQIGNVIEQNKDALAYHYVYASPSCAHSVFYEIFKKEPKFIYLN